MPSRNCSVCGQKIVWKPGNWKFELKRQPYFCSAKCAMNWLLGINSGVHPTCLDGCSYTEPHPCKTTDLFSTKFGIYFRSKYELLVAESFLLYGFCFEYEKWLFNVDGTYYLPDFLVKLSDVNVLIEVKGVWEPGSKKKVFSYMEAYGDELPLVVFPWNLFKSFERLVHENCVKNRKGAFQKYPN